MVLGGVIFLDTSFEENIRIIHIIVIKILFIKSFPFHNTNALSHSIIMKLPFIFYSVPSFITSKTQTCPLILEFISLKPCHFN